MNLPVKLNNGQHIDQLGLGVYKVNQDIAVQLVGTALDLGYRRIDTAALYDNEQEVGAAIRKSGIDREEIYVTTKVWNNRQGYHEAKEAVEESLERLNIGYVDMMLIHWPAPKQNKFVETWKAFEELLEDGKVRGIGVANFNIHHLEQLLESTNVVPALNQVELNPIFQQPELRAFNAKHGIATEAWAPLGRARILDNPILTELAEAHAKSPAQIVIRWHLQIGNLVIPKSSNPDRLAENLNVFDFALSDSDMAVIATMDTGVRSSNNPDDFD
jgi:2,5-diketo-D-gluconate reductase A